MPRPSGARRLHVFQNGRHVGILNKASDGAIAFRYSADWLDAPARNPVSISLPLQAEPYRGDAVVNVFDNLLPDAPRVRRNVATRLGAAGLDTFSLLEAVGQDCVGALQFLSDESAPGTGEVEAEPLSEADVADLLRNLRINPLGNDPDGDFRLSLAGAQDKTALLYANGEWHRPVGPTATTHILKPAIGELEGGIDMRDSVANEYLCLKLCEAFGLEVAKAEIVSFEDQTVLSVERFDRLWLGDGRLVRLPQEDLCQALSVPSTRKYQSEGGPGMVDILHCLRESDDPVQDQTAFLRAQMVFWLIGATDGHAKNVSIAHTRSGFRLTPLYDVLSAQPAVDAGTLRRNRFKMAMTVGDNNRNRMDVVLPRHFQQTADRAGLPRDTVARLCAELSSQIDEANRVVAEARDPRIPSAIKISLARRLENRTSHIRKME